MFSKATIIGKILGTCISGAFSNAHMPNPFPHPTNNVLREYPQFFQVSTLFSKKELLENSEKDALLLWGNPEIAENYEYCITVPRTLVHDFWIEDDCGQLKRQYLHEWATLRN